MNESMQRVVLYGAGGAVIAALSWAGFIYEADPDYGTLLNSARMRAQVAAMIPDGVADPALVKLREDGLRDAESLLETAEKNDPGTSAVRQLQAWIAVQRGDLDTAAERYREAREGSDLNAEGRRMLGQMLASVLSNGGRYDEALQVLDADQEARSATERVSAGLLRARILERSGQGADARRCAVEVVASTQQGSALATEAAVLLEQLGAWSDAEAAWGHAATEEEIRDYHVARLKLRSGASDNAVRLLERATERGGEPVRDLLRQERELWLQAMDDSALEKLLEPTAEDRESETPTSRKEEEKV